MRRLIAIATLAVFVLPAFAQRGGGHGAMGARGGFASHASISHMGAGFNRGWSGSGSGRSFGHSRFRGRFHHHGFHRRGFGYGYDGYQWGWSFYDPGFWDYSYSEPQAYYPVDVQAAYNDQQQVERRLDRIENRLDNMIERLDSARSAPPQPAQSVKAEPTPPTTLVFRDGHSEQVQNYAVVGNTLWIFNEDHARKVPLAQINTDATEKANEQRGVDVHFPKG